MTSEKMADLTPVAPGDIVRMTAEKIAWTIAGVIAGNDEAGKVEAVARELIAAALQSRDAEIARLRDDATFYKNSFNSAHTMWELSNDENATLRARIAELELSACRARDKAMGPHTDPSQAYRDLAAIWEILQLAKLKVSLP